MLWKLLRRHKLLEFTKKETASAVSFLCPLQKHVPVMVIMNKNDGCRMDIFSESFAGYILEFFVDSATMYVAIFGTNNLKRGI